VLDPLPQIREAVQSSSAAHFPSATHFLALLQNVPGPQSFSV
jgi:hypothetical protein